ncbi:RAP domain-containing protein [Sulfurimonas autotrophica]|uniref:DUF559 domain-containing protein n=1 Tax=Sulfurimonas autotrophica (strain ATCC BAA-671 / DSM 16294 / JCM 11897 / OK10) TaxID=563040 RepID=E0UTC4_SULAO|nr:RAP domain-containing protein [Sulfurimonas autotrophica]ADN08227.1 hypothetical protein Saut_0178 [Sulfurimonas autotrophica DSM 16294]
MSNYLTEKSLGKYLKQIFPKHEFIRDRVVPNSDIQKRPDYRNDDLMLIIEFDGYGHYSNPDNILTDGFKDDIYKDMGYDIVRIPYFIQMSKDIVELLFDRDVDIEQVYPHGFIDIKAMLPAYFCELGIIRFKKDLDKFKIVKDEIILSLGQKYDEYGNINYVLPPSLYNLLIEGIG